MQPGGIHEHSTHRGAKAGGRRKRGGSPGPWYPSKTRTDYVLIRKDLYERLTSEEYDDSPWTAEERDALAWQAGKHAGWEEMTEYDDVEQT